MRHFYCFLFLYLLSACVKKDKVTSRSFYLGVTTWPPDFNQKAEQLNFDFINDHCDMVSFHFDDGVPWDEMFHQEEIPSVYLEKIKKRRQAIHSDKKVLLSVSALQISRKDKSSYLKDSPRDQATKSFWENKSFRDTMVVRSYFNYLQTLIGLCHPDYINFGVESNHKDWNATQFQDYLYFLSRVYHQLKTVYPQTPCFVSVMVGPPQEKGWLQQAKALDTVSDYLGLSAYPYSYIGSPVYGSADPKLMPKNLFEDYLNIHPGKAWCFAETGYIAEDLDMSVLHKKATPQHQADYIQKIFDLSNANQGAFIIWFCPYDYDAAMNTFQALGYMNELPKLWQNSGLIDEWLRPRISYTLWERYREKEKK